MRSTNASAFTLIEVIVALGIAATALILLLSANSEALRRSLGSRQRETIEWLTQSKLDELACGAESSRQGAFAGFPDIRWEATLEPAALPGLQGLQRLTLRVLRSSQANTPVLTASVFVYPSGASNAP